MKSFKISLCSHETEKLIVIVRATMCNSRLTIEGHDLGKKVKEYWGDDDYEYSYTFDTKRLLETINGKSSPQCALRNHFSGPEGCGKLRELCKANNIAYSFFSWV